MITVKNIAFQYDKGDFHLNVNDLTIARGEKVAFVGPSGSGKTTLLNLVAGILPFKGGSIKVDDDEINTLGDSSRRNFRIKNIGFIFQDFGLLDYLDVHDNILHPYRITDALKLNPDVRNRAAMLAEQMGIADKLGISIEIKEGLQRAAVIHDLGKVAVPSEILSKPGRLTDIEFQLIKTHAQVGHDMLSQSQVDFPWPIAEIVHQHHERIDGTGYPCGLKGEEILIEAKILSVADVVEAMASHRPYRVSLGIDAALDEIRQNRGKIYDPEVVDACLSLFHDDKYILN